MQQERTRPAASTSGPAAPTGARPLPSLAEERARTAPAPIPLPDAPPGGLSASNGMPDWWLVQVLVADGRYAVCAEGDGVSFIGARQVALDQAVAKLKAAMNAEPADLKTDRVSSTQSGGMFRVRVRVSGVTP